jgi:hypothetical protein
MMPKPMSVQNKLNSKQILSLKQMEDDKATFNSRDLKHITLFLRGYCYKKIKAFLIDILLSSSPGI